MILTIKLLLPLAAIAALLLCFSHRDRGPRPLNARQAAMTESLQTAGPTNKEIK